MCSSSMPAAISPARRPVLSRVSGFSLIEMVVALALTLLLVCGVMAFWLGTLRAHTERNDHLVTLLQGRVALHRFERDLRAATLGNLADQTPSPLLRATRQEVVLIARGKAGALQLIEWELTDGRLMRRTGPLNGTLPSAITHALYSDNKTMLETPGLQGGLTYTGRKDTTDIGSENLPDVSRVRMELWLREQRSGLASLQGAAWLGR